MHCTSLKKYEGEECSTNYETTLYELIKSLLSDTVPCFSLVDCSPILTYSQAHELHRSLQLVSEVTDSTSSWKIYISFLSFLYFD